MMKIGVLGTGNVGETLGAGLLGLGHTVMIGSRDPGQEKVRAWLAGPGKGASAGTFAEAAEFGELLVFAVNGEAVEAVIAQAGVARFAGKVVIDTTNPLAVSAQGMELTVGFTDSLGERVQRLLPEARVVKAYNSVGFALMVHPQLPGGPPDMFIAGNDDDAKAAVTEILHAFGWQARDLGGITAARYLEPLAVVWINLGIRYKHWNHAFKLLGWE